MTSTLLIQSVIEIRSLQSTLLNTLSPSPLYPSDAVYERHRQATENFDHALDVLRSAVRTLWLNAPDIGSGVGLSLDGLMSCLAVHDWTGALSVIRTELP